jgi:uncharacterized membrane protein
MPDWVHHGPMALWRDRRWAVIAAVVGALIVLYLITSSAITSIIVVIVLVALVVVAMLLAARFAENSGHQPAGRGPGPTGQDAQDVWQSALRHLPDTFTTTPDRTMLAADLVELRMNPDDLRALGQSIDPGLVTNSSCDAYRARIAEASARLTGNGQPRVALVSDPELPPGRYRLQPRPSEPLASPPPAPAAPPAHGDRPASDWQHAGGDLPAPDWQNPGGDRPGQDWQNARTEAVDQMAGAQGPMTVSERMPIPPLRLLTGGTVAETRTSGARAGRGGDVELRLPDVPTVSRVHAELNYSDGRWWITNQGRNGLTVNGNLVTGQSPVSDGDVIQWGNRHDALTSRVQVG